MQSVQKQRAFLFVPPLVLVSLAVIWLGVWLRLYRFGAVPVSLYWDEAAMLADARSLALSGADIHGEPWLQSLYLSYGDFKQPVYILFAALSVALFGASEFSLRLPSLLAGLGSLILIWYIAKELFSAHREALAKNSATAIAWISAAVLAVSPWAVQFSRTGFEAHIGQFFLSCAVLASLKAHKNYLWFGLATVFASLATYSYYSVRFIWIGLFIALVLSITSKQWGGSETTIKKRTLTGVAAVISLVLYLVSLMPMRNSPFYAESNQFRLSTESIFSMQDWPIVRNKYRLAAGNTVFDKVFFHPIGMQGIELAKNIARHTDFDTLFLQGDDNLRHSTTRHGLLLLFFAPFFYIGFAQLLRKHQSQAIILGTWWLLALVPASVPVDVPHALRSLNAVLPLSIITALGAWSFVEWTRLKTRLTKALLYSFLTLTFLASVGSYAYYFFTVYPTASASDWQSGYKEIAQTADKLSKNHSEVWIENFDSQLFVWYLAFGSLQPADAATEIGTQRQPGKIANVSFRQYFLHEQATSWHTIAVIGSSSFVEARAKDTGFSVNNKQMVVTVNKTPIYSATLKP